MAQWLLCRLPPQREDPRVWLSQEDQGGHRTPRVWPGSQRHPSPQIITPPGGHGTVLTPASRSESSEQGGGSVPPPPSTALSWVNGGQPAMPARHSVAFKCGSLWRARARFLGSKSCLCYLLAPCLWASFLTCASVSLSVRWRW